jgi:hypothetical protein
LRAAKYEAQLGDPIIPTKSISSWFRLSSAILVAAVCPSYRKFRTGWEV